MELHTIEPFYDKNSKILILGSFPSVKSRETGFYYGHSQNRFWKVLAAVFGCSEPKSIADKKAFLAANGVALWDVVGSCEIQNSADSTIKNATPNDIERLLRQSKIEKIFINGKTAEKLYIKYILPTADVPAVCLPSTSPANAAWSVERLLSEWQEIAK